METGFDEPHPNGAVTTVEARKRPTWRRWLLLAVFVLVGIAWLFAILFSVTRDSPEDLDDAALRSLSDACHETRSQLESLPALPEDPTAAQVIALVRDENGIFLAMADRVDEIGTSSEEAQAALDAWVGDWRDLMETRAAFADDLEDDGTARLSIPTVTRGSLEPVTDRMDEYATGRGLDECRPLALQAEVVDTPRDYTAVEV